MKTLMHICCAPCANQPIEVLRTDGIEVAGFWYNPNIHPVTEYRARRNCLEAYAKEIELPRNMASISCTGISGLTSETARTSPGSMASICRNTAAASFPKKSATSKPKN